jgi:hypothetical protein
MKEGVKLEESKRSELFVIFMFVSIILIIYGFFVSFRLGLLLLVLPGLVISYLEQRIKKKDSKIKKEKRIKLFDLEGKLKNFTITQKYESCDLESFLLLDERNKKIGFAFVDSNSTEIYDYKDILASEIVEDGETVTITSRSTSISGAIIGGAIAGETGAIIGGLSGKTRSTTETKIHKIDLKIVVNNTKLPNKIINFLTGKPDLVYENVGVKKDSPEYKEAIKYVNHWHSLFGLLIKQEQTMQFEKKIEMNNYLSVAEEIKNLSELLKQGLLTQDEFDSQKHKLLS